MNEKWVEERISEILESRQLEGLDVNVGTEDRTGYVKLLAREDPLKWAIVSSPGDRWFSVNIPDGFSYDVFSEDLEESEAVAVLEDLLDVAIAYVRGRFFDTRVGWLQAEAIGVRTGLGLRVLRRSVSNELLAAIRRKLSFRSRDE